MSVIQDTIVTARTPEGVEVKVKQETIKQVLQATTLDGVQVLIDPDGEDYTTDTTVMAVFDDLGDPKVLKWTNEDTPDDCWRIVTVALWDGAKFVFSHPREAAKFLSAMKPLVSPREKAAGVVNISEYRPENGK